MSRIGRLVTFLILSTAFVVGYTMLQPAVVAYQVKMVARISCNQIIREFRAGQIGTNQSSWAREFQSRAAMETGLRFEKEQFDFAVEGKDPRGDLFCNAKIKFPTSTPWVGISEVVDLPPYKVMKVVKIERQRAAAGF